MSRSDGPFRPLNDEEEFAQMVSQGTETSPIGIVPGYPVFQPPPVQGYPSYPTATEPQPTPFVHPQALSPQHQPQPQPHSYAQPQSTQHLQHQPQQFQPHPQALTVPQQQHDQEPQPQSQPTPKPAQQKTQPPPPPPPPSSRQQQQQRQYDVEMQTFSAEPASSDAGGAGDGADGPIEYDGNRYDVLFCRTTSSTIAFFGYRRIVLYLSLASWFVAAWLCGLAYFLSGGHRNILWWTLLIVLGADLIATAMTIVDNKVWKERYIDCIWYGSSFALMLIPFGFVVASAYETSSYAEGLCSTALTMVIVPMAYCWLEAILRCVLQKCFQKRLAVL